MSSNLNTKPKQRNQEILDMQDKFYQELCQKDLQIFRLKQKIRETESEILVIRETHSKYEPSKQNEANQISMIKIISKL